VNAMEALNTLAAQGPALVTYLESAYHAGPWAGDPGIKKAIKIAKKLNGDLHDFIVKMPNMPNHLLLVEVKKEIAKFGKGTEELKGILRGHVEKN